MGSPPEACVSVAKCVLILVRSEKKNHAWPNAQKMMGNPNKFLQEVKDFKGESIDEWKLKAIDDNLKDPNFNQQFMKSKSIAASFLCAWVVNIAKYNTIYLKVKPLQEAAAAAQALADAKQAELAVAEQKKKDAEDKVEALKQQLNEAEAKKKAVEDAA